MKLSAVLHSVDGRTCEVEIEFTGTQKVHKKEYTAAFWRLIKPCTTNMRFHKYDGEYNERALTRAIEWVYQQNKSVWWSVHPFQDDPNTPELNLKSEGEDDPLMCQEPELIELDEQQLRFAKSKSLEDLRRIRDRQQYPEGKERIQELVDWKKQQEGGKNEMS